MRFDATKFFAYDQTKLTSFSFKDIVGKYDGNTGDPHQKFALSGLGDLWQTLLIIEEYYNRNFAKLDVKELRRGGGENPVSVDPLYNEPMDVTKQFNRVLQIPLHIDQQDKETKLEKQGAQINHEVTFTAGIINLFRADFFPEIGDEVIWQGTLYQIGEVYYPKATLFQHTGFPLHVAMTTSIQHFGDEKIPDRLTDLKTKMVAPPAASPPTNSPQDGGSGYGIPVK
jgi:hypothetical protein